MLWEGSAIAYWYPVIALAAAAVRAGSLWPDARTRTAGPWSCEGPVAAYAKSAPAAHLTLAK